jgi:hypothetical protein
LSGAAGAVIDARTQKAKDRKDAADELNQLTRERQILEEKVKIQEAQQKLQQPE